MEAVIFEDIKSIMSSPRDPGAPEAAGIASECGSPGAQRRTTPPEKPRVRNPFERALLHRLHTPICSPGMCKVYKKARDGTFRWEIEQRCTLMPVDIVACSSQFEPSPDPLFDKLHEETTERFFSQEVVVPSPFVETTKKMKPLISSSGSSHVEEYCTKIVRDTSAQTVLTLPPHLPPEVEALLESFCTFTQDQTMSSEYELSHEGSSWMRRKLELEGHSYCHSDSEQTDEEHPTPQQYQSYETHARISFSPDLSRTALSKGMKRTFGTPVRLQDKKFGCHNKILDGVEHGEPGFSPSPISFRGTPATPASAGATGSSLASHSISPVAKVLSSDDEKQNETSPDVEAIATCLNCVSSRKDQKRRVCYCRPPGSSVLIRSASMKSPSQRGRQSRDVSLGKRSASMSSLNRSRSVQRLDFSLDMSVDGSMHHSTEDIRSHSALAGSDSSGSPHTKATWQGSSLTKSDLNIFKAQFHSEDNHTIDETPIKGKSKTSVLNHAITHITTGKAAPLGSPMNISLDTSLDNPLHMEDKKIDFNSIDLKLLTSSKFEFRKNEPVPLKRFDSGFNDNTSLFGKSSYYESAIKPSELTVTDLTKSTNASQALKEVSNVNWMRVDSGFKDETSSDNVQFYAEGTSKGPQKFCFSEAALDGPDKENVFIEDFDKFLVRASTRDEVMSISDIFADEMAMNCNFSSTPSKNKVRK